MKINFQTHSELQRARFGNTRSLLSGERQFRKSDGFDEVTLFSSEQLRAGSSERVEPIVVQRDLDPTVKEAAASHAYQAAASHAYQAAKSKNKSASKSLGKKLLNLFLSLIAVVSLLVAAVVFVPAAYYLIFPADVLEIVPQEQGTPLGGAFDEPILEKPEEKLYAPPKDKTLPEGDWLIIPRIGVRTELRKTQNPDEALQQGVWHVPDFGVPGDRTQPMILAAHRYGWQWWWKSDYWKYNSFYLLPDTEPGDIIEVISDQRKWIYEIYAGEEGEQITDYNADLILYTCKYLQSPLRHFRYARLIDPTANTQGLR